MMKVIGSFLNKYKNILNICCLFAVLFLLTGCAQRQGIKEFEVDENTSLASEQPLEIVDNAYADEFLIKRYEKGYSVIEVSDGRKYLLVPEGIAIPKDFNEYTIIKKNVNRIYLAGTSVMSLFDSLNILDNISFSSQKKEDWYIENAQIKMTEGKIVYAGKYSSPDFELLINDGCNLAIESTMILHKPDILEKLEELGIPVFIERSSYEKNPLGRLEWIKVYGEMCGCFDDAEAFFEEQCKKIAKLVLAGTDEKTVAFFYMNQNGMVVTKKSSDYVPKMISMAGGKYILEDIGDDEQALSSVNMTMEDFFVLAKDADFIIYNGTITDAPEDIQSLIEKSELLADFKAVKDRNVYCMNKSVYQESSQTADIIKAINNMLNEKSNDLLYKLEG